MKNKFPFILLILCLFFSFENAHSQVEYLRLSPAQKIIQRVGATDIILEFSRPQMKGRKVFGELVPYGKMWRTGANENTKITFNHRVKIGKTIVEEGTYALFTKPTIKYWDIFLYKDTNNLDIPNPIDSTKLLYLMRVDAKKIENLAETLIINLYNLTETTAHLGITWESTEVMIPITFYTQEAMEKALNKEFKQNIFDYKIAAIYYAQRSIELEKARKLQELAIELSETPSSWDYHYYGIILNKLGERDKALEAIKYSLTLAEATNNKGLIKANKKLLDNW